MVSDLKINRACTKLPIEQIAKKYNIGRKYLFLHGDYIAKVEPEILGGLRHKPQAKYIIVTAMTPTSLGEGKTVTTIGLSMAFNRLRKRSFCCIRQPSLGPVFGIKGGAAGGGYSQILPMEDLNLHLTGDSSAVESAHNLASAFLDNAVYRNSPAGIDKNNIAWKRVIDINDRALRRIKTGLGLGDSSLERESGFENTAGSEVMAILSLSSSFSDLRKRLGRIVLAYTKDNRPVTTEDIKVAGSMAALLKNAFKPNLLQTTENTPCFVHTGPFGNIAHGNSSVIADEIACSLCDYVVTESGFGTDCGLEKFFAIKCSSAARFPDAAVLVCSVRAIKSHSSAGILEEGMCNLRKHIENVKSYGIGCVVAVNRFEGDTDQEIEFIKGKSLEFGADDCHQSRLWQQGSKGGLELAKSVMRVCSKPAKPRCLYPAEMSIKEKIRRVASAIYGAGAVTFSPTAEKKIELFSGFGWDTLPVCIAKTQYSLSADPHDKGCPSGFTVPVKDIRAYVGAGFLTPLCANIMTMPGLPAHPRGEGIDIDEKGMILGLS